MEITFEKWEDGRWFVILPDYDGDQSFHRVSKKLWLKPLRKLNRKNDAATT